MRNTSKMTTLENKFPLLAVEHSCIISKDADITVAFEVELPELYTVTGAEYEAIHGCWCKAIKVLPDFCVVHKQDWFIKERYKPELEKDDMSFLSRSFERHFNERPYLKHSCYLYLTKTTKERNRMQSNFSTLCRGHIIPKELDRETAGKFMEAAEQFERIMNDSGFVRLRRLSTDEIVGTEKSAGLIERYFSLMPEGDMRPCRTSTSRQKRCVSATTACACTPSPTRRICPVRWRPTPATRRLSTDRSGLPPLLRLPRGAAAFLQPHLQPVCDYRQQRGKFAEVREVRKEYAVAIPIQPEQQHQPRVDRPVPERSPFLRADLGTGALQRHGVER